ncbi:hypothetical protein GCM10009037_30760 [Halarchaeum grantii]|uniref:Uncharacterized protein n=1 Tax=Halarchaeum grantii TaxID=1193105 RepID=A0A830F705_9EURY|nr:hypothetical protein [Halarchaeum grantii]GGL45189.1 hypothetical protein GCM10009037_30760 [Halarchaeum grantii]
MKDTIIEAIRQPEYTGENRCEPCTALNLVIAGVVGSAIARKSKLGGTAAFGVSAGLIYLRGYLVPGTPTLTKQYLPRAVLRWFGKQPELEARDGLGSVPDETVSANNQSPKSTISESNKPVEEIDPHDFLLTEGIIEPCEARDDLCLTKDFSNQWDAEISTLSEKELDASEAVSILGVQVEGDGFEIEQYGEARTLVAGSQTIGKWPSQGALLADVGAAHVLDEWSDEWNDIGPAQKGEILNGLRLFLEHCPGSKGSVSMSQETVESCCSSHEVITVSCDDTGERLFEQRLSEI